MWQKYWTILSVLIVGSLVVYFYYLALTADNWIVGASCIFAIITIAALSSERGRPK